MSDISTLLVANRGEIALRVMRTARDMGMRTVAVFSDADADAPHVRFADDAVHIGASPVGESYLVGEKIIAAARDSGADAIHPGYGFLSENAAFANAVAEAGLIFVGPPPGAVDLMGDKARAKRRMIEADVPCVPGYEGEGQSNDRFISAANEIGFPVMVKAAAGGGGRGMRLVETAGDLPSAIDLARSEAENAFGSGELILEKAIIRPRHVEIQVFADQHGNVIHLGERDCSVQRRHQKVIEEAPCPIMTKELRAAMGAAAVEAAQAVDYVGAGTVEFLLDEQGSFYFLEMNTRLQVEHPVTELVTGLDLVALQLRVAQGAPLGLEQSDVQLNGHAIEVRLYAEDPEEDFLPSTGPIMLWQPPEGEGIRVDDGIATDGEVSPFYDAMVAKIIANGTTRDEARRRLVKALERTALFGLRTNRDFLIDALNQSKFASGEATTAFIAESYGDGGFSTGTPTAADLAAAATIHHKAAQAKAHALSLNVNDELLDWASNGTLETVLQYQIGDDVLTLNVEPLSQDDYHVRIGDENVRVQLKSMDENGAKLSVDGRGVEAIWRKEGATLHLALPGRNLALTDLTSSFAGAEEAGGGGTVTAPMHGRLLEILVASGDQVKKGDKLAILEAMKMQHELLAEVDGTVKEVIATADTQIAADDLILEIEPTE